MLNHKPLSKSALQRLYPGISDRVSRGLLLPGNAHSVNPGAMVQALADRFKSEGGHIIVESVLRIWRDGSSGWTVMTNFGNHRSDGVVMAAGIWSDQLLRPLGLRVPMESERGYHAVVRTSSIELSMPILNKSRYFGLCSMDDGLRVSGTVEIAGLNASPDLARAKTLARQACELFPDLGGEEIYWMGHRPSLPDGLPMIGPVHGHPGLNLCFGHGHSGLTAAPQSGKLLAELMCNEQVTVDPEPYSPARFLKTRKS